MWFVVGLVGLGVYVGIGFVVMVCIGCYCGVVWSYVVVLLVGWFVLEFMVLLLLRVVDGLVVALIWVCFGWIY